MKVAALYFGYLVSAILLAEAFVSECNFKCGILAMLKLCIARLHASTVILSVQTVIMLITKETLELMEHWYVHSLSEL